METAWSWLWPLVMTFGYGIWLWHLVYPLIDRVHCIETFWRKSCSSVVPYIFGIECLRNSDILKIQHSISRTI